MVPRSAEHPFALGQLLGLFADATGKFLRCVGIAQVHAADFASAAAEMHMRVDESGEDAFPLSIDPFRCRPGPFCDFCVRADRNNMAVADGNSLRARVPWIDGPYVPVNNNQVSKRKLLRVSACRGK